ncbi:Peptidyl-tRNA hydrolase [Alteracholeplasma palmae J233]|uniref:Peptidyl-tRNA hydrolase n=1 Tax=Alteracholeplasma palmae (strain ATCC 49389 / J233) TaxID=1318466 RepID=U4KNC1_ALTPJ|nr:aminoacyl-tRNA hydrolase [Alteracholeplasma palmae]CCV63675.1 Peptidyl-tRNA hydrolase [Alteracholeplasma palmae J233]
MKLIVGLGNPGDKYENTRHNMGFIAIDFLLTKHKLKTTVEQKFNAEITTLNLGNEKAIIAKPLTYMNLSGEAVRKIMDYYKIEPDDLIVIVDDINLPTGKLRLREMGSHGGQNGLKNIILNLKTEKFKRIRIGIDQDTRMPLDKYVLGKLTKDEENLIYNKLPNVIDAIEAFIKEEPYKDIMTKYNTQA